MPANVNPIFVLTPNVGTAVVTTANTTRDLSDTTNASLLFTAGTDGSRIDTITFTHVATAQTQASVAAVGRIWITTSAAGANPRLLSEIALPVATPSSTAIGGSQTITFANGLFLANGQFLWCAISATQTSAAYNVIARGGNY
jgi:sugar lactone lactonase YvrE